MAEGPVRVYSDQWYQKHRPNGSINFKKQVVDNKLIEVMNKQKDIDH